MTAELTPETQNILSMPQTTGNVHSTNSSNLLLLTEYEIGTYEDAEQVNGMALTPKFS
jgi:hypothetical protein